MTLVPILNAPWLDKLHLVAVAAAVVIGAFLMVAPKEARGHRAAGWMFSGLVIFAAGASLFLSRPLASLPAPIAVLPFHVCSVGAAAGLPVAVWAARTGRVLTHRAAMIGVYAGGLLASALFAVLR